ncbi:MAG: hypothetical protein ACD_79C01481G0001 [uncultured bacterium]|nr:MAG: hypothetical protein ACD_79C01481G0001 [uncultured bacterium]
MFIRVKEKSNGKKSVQLVESYRRGNNVSQKIIRHVGQAVTDKEVEALKQLAETIRIEMENIKQPVLPLFAPEKIYSKTEKRKDTEDKIAIKNLREEQRIVEGIGDVFGKLYSDLNFDDLLDGTRKDEQWNTTLKSCVLARVANPVSKRRTASLLEEDYAIKIPLEKIYRMMDRLTKQEESIRSKILQSTLNLFQDKVDILFFDVTTLYFESQDSDELREFGYSKDCKFNQTQVVLALITTTGGLPIGYELFPGNIYEGNTLITMVQDLKKKFNVENIILAADRAMFSEANLSYMESENISYIVAAKLRKLSKELKHSIITSEDYNPQAVGDELHWTKEWEVAERRLIVSYSQKRAIKDASDRQRLVDKLMKKNKNGKVNIKDILPHHGAAKYLKVESGIAVIREDKIAEDAKWDGLHGVITNIKDKKSFEILERYKGLWQIEESFRISKHDLKMRPIYHWTPERIRAHILICFIAYTLVRQATYRLNIRQIPMSFEHLRNELLHTQSSILLDKSTGKHYRLPSHVTALQKSIYQTFGLKRSDSPQEIL